MKLKKSLVAMATGLGLSLTAATAGAINLGEVWVGDQQDGKLYIFDQADLNNPFVDAQETTIDLTTVPGGVNSTRLHLVGFTNHNGLDPDSRAILAYLNGWAEIWKTNGGTHAPELVTKLEVSTTNTGGAKDSLHMCGGNPQNTLLGCSSIGNKEIVLFRMDVETDTYTRIGNFPLSGLEIHKKVKGSARKAIKAAIADGILNGAPICNNFDTRGKLLYVTTNNAGVGGVLVLDVSKPKKPRIRDAYNGTAVGCGLVNSQDGRYMWTNAGSKNAEDDEKAYKWRFWDAYLNWRSGPAAVVDLPEIGGGDVHGAQFAGIGGPFLWELMRLDDKIYVVEPHSAKVVNTIDLETPELMNPAGDVLDRSAFGTRMYASLRGALPTTAIVGINDPNRRPGVMVIGTIFGYNGWIMKIEDIQSGNLVAICPVAGDEADPDHDHGGYEICDDTHPHWDDHELVDSADPHGLKSLSYLTGGF